MERKPTRFEIRLPAEMGDAIDSWRRGQTDIPPRAEAARRLIAIGLGAEPILRDLIAWLDSAPYEDPETKRAVAEMRKILGED